MTKNVILLVESNMPFAAMMAASDALKQNFQYSPIEHTVLEALTRIQVDVKAFKHLNVFPMVGVPINPTMLDTYSYTIDPAFFVTDTAQIELTYETMLKVNREYAAMLEEREDDPDIKEAMTYLAKEGIGLTCFTQIREGDPDKENLYDGIAYPFTLSKFAHDEDTLNVGLMPIILPYNQTYHERDRIKYIYETHLHDTVEIATCFVLIPEHTMFQNYQLKPGEEPVEHRMDVLFTIDTMMRYKKSVPRSELLTMGTIMMYLQNAGYSVEDARDFVLEALAHGDPTVKESIANATKHVHFVTM